MRYPERGEIWRVKFRDRVGSELRGATNDERPCLIVSRNSYNAGCPRVTIAPITGYRPFREDVRSLWGVTIDCSSEVAPDPQVDPATGKDYPEEEKFLLFKGNMPYSSIIDCGQLWTIFAPDPTQEDLRILIPEHCHDLRWDRRHGKIKERATIAVDAALQVLVGGGIRYEGNLPFHEGAVLIAKFPGMFGEIHQQRCLVVSSTAVDAIRMRMPRRGGNYNQCTVVPLEPITEEDKEDDLGIAIVNVYPVGAGSSIKEVAMCQELYTLDWSGRDAYGPVGRVRNEDMGFVREALRDYLGLPR